MGDPLGRVWAWLNVHHGPFLHAAGAIGEVRGPGEGPAQRHLKYFYGSYAISTRRARPTRLRFWAEEGGGGKTATLRLDALVRRPFVRVWDLGQRTFWSRFPRRMDAALQRPAP